MRKSDCFIDGFFLLLYQLLSGAVLCFATWMILKIANALVVVNYFASGVIYALGLGIGMGILLVVYGYITGYRAASYSLPQDIIASLSAIVLHLLFAAAFHYAPLVGGAALPLSGILSLGTEFSSKEAMSKIHGLLPLILFLALMVIYHALMLMTKHFAVRKRLRDRMRLTGQSESCAQNME